MSALATNLFREVRADFFRVLASPLAALYVDVLDALEREATQRTQGLDRVEAFAVIEQILERHGDVAESSGDPISSAATVRDKARVILDTLRNAGWVQEEERSDWQRLVYFDPNGVLLLQALRKIAFPEAAVFSDKIVSVCVALINKDALAEQTWAQIESCTASLQQGLAELRGMQKSIERHTKQQLATSTLKENLAVIYDQFAEQIGRTCYAQFVHARLPSRLAEARRAMDDLQVDVELLDRMQTEVMRRDSALSSEAAMAHVRLRLNDLGELLDQVEPLADAIDRHTADFTRRSQARFRYLQETTSENRARVQQFFETLNRHFSGHRVGEADALGIEYPALLVHDVKVLGGLESLCPRRLRRAAGEIEPLDDPDSSQQDHALAQLERNLRDSLTVSRANQFVSMLPGERGTHWQSSDLLRERVHNDEDVADLIACLLHSRSADARFEVQVPRHDRDNDAADFDRKLQYRVEQFTLIKK